MKAKLIKFAAIAALAFVAVNANADHHLPGEKKAAVEAACVQDAATAGCGDKAVGTGLMKCLKAYKKANKDFKFSDSCKGAVKEFRAERKEMKKNK